MTTVEAPLSERPHDEAITPLLHRVRSEFLEMPGLRLTPAQAARLWGLDRHTSERILDRLAMAGFLSKNKEGAYLSASEG
jgi:DNA-binding MarR family transcriptional regulator